MPSNAIVDSRLFIKLDLSNATGLNSRYRENRANLAHLASQLLLYDRILIPTYDYGIVPTLYSWLGFDLFQELLESDALGFIRRRGLLAYVGNGNGVNVFEIEEGDKPLLWWQESIFAENQTALELQLAQYEIHPSEQQSILDMALERTIDLSYSNEFFIDQIANESYRDVMESPDLAKYVWQSSDKREDGGVDLRWLPQVDGDQMRVLPANGSIDDPVDLVLRAAEVNMELLMANQAGDADLFTTEGADKLLLEKLRRAGAEESMLAAFMSLLELNAIPDLRSAVSSGDLEIERVWELRNSSESVQFRQWLREASPSDSRELEQAYIAAISEVPRADRWSTKVIRIVITTVAGLIPGVGGLVGGIGAEVVDSFVIDRLINGFSPKLFLDELQKLELGNAVDD